MWVLGQIDLISVAHLLESLDWSVAVGWGTLERRKETEKGDRRTRADVADRGPHASMTELGLSSCQPL